jgi:ABC-type transporter Mla subunit MlaD
MAQSNTTVRHLILGLLFFGSLFALAYVTSQLRNFPGMGTSSVVNVLFEDVNGVRREDSVFAYGTRFGRVTGVTPIAREAWDATGRGEIGDAGRTFIPNVLVEIELETPLTLRDGFGVFASDANLLGGKQVDIEPGDARTAPIDMGPNTRKLDVTASAELKKVTLYGYSRPHPITSIGKVVDDNKDGIKEIVDNLRTTTSNLNDPNKGPLGYLIASTDARAKLDNTLDALDKLATQSKTNGNLINELFYGEKMRNDFTAVGDNLRKITDDAKNPESMIGGLTQPNAPMKKNLDKAIDDIGQILADARRPGNLISRITDDSPGSIGDDLKSISSGIRNWIDDVNSNTDSLVYKAIKGDLGRTVDNAFAEIDRQAENIGTNVIDPIAQSKGALGYLINDPESKQDLRRLINATLGIIEDAREAAPISGLGSFIFGAF